MGGNYRGSVVRTAKSFIEIIGLFWVIKIVLNTTNFPNYDTLAPFPSIALSPSLSRHLCHFLHSPVQFPCNWLRVIKDIKTHHQRTKKQKQSKAGGMIARKEKLFKYI